MAVHVSHARLPYPIQNARYSFLVPFLDAEGDPTDPTTPDTEVSQDNGAFADAAEEISTASGSNGMGLITLTGAETNNSTVGVAVKVASGPKATLMTLYPRNLAIVGSGTLSAGSAGGGTLGTVLAYDVTGCFIRTTGGTGGGGTGGANNQARRMITYTPSTGAFTVSPNWETTVSTDTTYDVLLPEGVTLGMLKALNPTTGGRTLDVSAGGEAGLDWANVGSPTTALNLSGTSTKALEPTTAGRTLDVSAGGEAGVDWANVGSPTTTLNLSGTTISAVSGAVGSVTGAVGSVTGNVGGNVAGSVGSVTARVTANVDQLGGGAQSLTDLKDFADTGYDPATHKVAGVVLTDTVTTYTGNTPQTGDSYALANGVNGFVAIKTDTAAILDDTGTSGVVVAAASKTGYRLSATGVDDIWDEVMEGSTTARQSIRLANTANGAKLSGAATTTVTIRDIGDTKDRVTATVDANGNRSAITLDLT